MKTKKAKRIRNLLLIVLVISLWLIGTVYSDYATVRLESRHLVYKPFSGVLFDLDPQEVRHAGVRGSFHPHNPLYSMTDYETPEEIAWAVEQFNSFRFWFWVPESVSYRKQKVTECPVFSVVFKDDRSIRGMLRENKLWVGEFKEGEMEAKGAWYYGGRDLYDALMALE